MHYAIRPLSSSSSSLPQETKGGGPHKGPEKQLNNNQDIPSNHTRTLWARTILVAQRIPKEIEWGGGAIQLQPGETRRTQGMGTTCPFYLCHQHIDSFIKCSNGIETGLTVPPTHVNPPFHVPSSRLSQTIALEEEFDYGL